MPNIQLSNASFVVIFQFVNYFANDCQRLHEVLVILPMTFSGPLMAVASTIYCVLYLGRWALLGAAVIAMYYPYQVSVSSWLYCCT
jgi:hypothetical protein